MGGGLGTLEVKPASKAIYIQDLASKVQTWKQLTFDDFEVDLFKISTSKGHKFFFEDCFNNN